MIDSPRSSCNILHCTGTLAANLAGDALPDNFHRLVYDVKKDSHLPL